jgi:hypothetical protein
LEFEIRRNILNYLDIKTSGLDAYTGFSPYEVHGISVDVILTK